jgi:hypothetical protein
VELGAELGSEAGVAPRQHEQPWWRPGADDPDDEEVPSS